MTELFAQVNKLDANKGLVTLRMDVNDIHKLQNNRTFEVSYYDYWNGKWDAINEGLSIPVTDYNNYIPLSAITMTDKHGKKLSNQYAQIGSPQREYFRMNGHYKVLHNYGDTIEIEVAGEPVSIQSKYAVADK